MHRAGGMPHQEDAFGIASTGSDVVRSPLDCRAQILRGCRPRRLWRQPIGGVDADKAVLHRPQHDVVVERAISGSLVACDEAAAMIALGGTIFDVPLDPDRRIGFFLL